MLPEFERPFSGLLDQDQNSESFDNWNNLEGDKSTTPLLDEQDKRTPINKPKKLDFFAHSPQLLQKKMVLSYSPLQTVCARLRIFKDEMDVHGLGSHGTATTAKRRRRDQEEPDFYGEHNCSQQDESNSDQEQSPRFCQPDPKRFIRDVIQNNHDDTFRGGKNSKGLKSLSENVYLLVKELGSTSYKFVADRLVKDFGDRLVAEDGSLLNRDQHNIKRRAYDALNVLIAAGLLKKEGKKVMPSLLSRDQRPPQVVAQLKQEKEELERRLIAKMAEIKEKRQIKAATLEKRKLIEQVLTRNSKMINGVHFTFPFVAVVEEERMIKLIENRQGRMQLLIGPEIVLYGDMDLLVSIPHIKQQ